jgi:putative hydrolase of the HAD superfamily
MKIKVISFDLDGTLSTPTFTNLIWNEGVPRLYAKAYSIGIEKAKKIVRKEYDKIGDEDINWYKLDYWFDRFSLKVNLMDLLEEFSVKIEFYPETEEVLSKMKNKYKLIISSNAAKEFISIEIDRLGKSFFSSIFSSASDFNQLKKDSSFYLRICKRLNVLPSEMIHIGDNYRFDYLAPKKVGLSAFYLNRKAKRTSNFVVRNLKEFLDRVNKLEDS